MLYRHSRHTPRRGMAALEVVIVTALALPMAAALYFLVEATLDRYFFLLSNAAGSPFLMISLGS